MAESSRIDSASAFALVIPTITMQNNMCRIARGGEKLQCKITCAELQEGVRQTFLLIMLLDGICLQSGKSNDMEDGSYGHPFWRC